MSAKVVDKKEKKDLIMEAALTVFSQQGFSRTTISAIAKKAGIGKGTIYEYFATKEEIIHNSFQFFMRHLELDFQKVLVTDMPALDKLKAIMDGFTHFLDAHTFEMMELMFQFWSEGIRYKESKGMLYQDMNKFYKAYREIFADVIIQGMGDGSFRKDINPHHTSSMIVGALDGIMVQWVLDQENFNYKEVVKTISFTLLNGIELKN